LNAILGNNTIAEAVHPLLTPRHPSQIYEGILEGLVLFFILWLSGKRMKRDGQVAALFFWCYALMRIFAEQFREPDIGIGFQLFGMTRGQWLSLGMIVLGGIIMYSSRQQKAVVPVSSQTKGIKPPGPKPSRKK
jgi:phosphatidylglycerol:prolipoprotein diacylglycerol transferase